MKVVHLVSYDIGGAGKAVMRICEAQNSVGIKSKVVVIQKKDNDNDVEEAIKNNLNLILFKIFRKIYTLFKAKMYDTNRFYELKYGLDLNNNTLIKEADIIHLHWIGRNIISYRSLKNMFQYNKIVFTAHDMWPFTAGCFYDGDCSKYENYCYECPYFKFHKNKVKKIWDNKKFLYSCADNITFVGCSKWITGCLRKSDLTKKYTSICVPNPININIFQKQDNSFFIKQKYGIDTDKKIVLFGAMSSDTDYRKGCSLLKAALNYINNDEYMAVIFGNKNQISEDEFEIDSVGLGTIHSEYELAEIYSVADVYVAPSRQENLSNAVMESLSCSLPVTAFDIGGMSDMISHKYNGYLAKPFDPLDLANGIVFCAKNNLLLGKNARSSVVDKYSYFTIGNQYKQLYDSIL